MLLGESARSDLGEKNGTFKKFLCAWHPLTAEVVGVGVPDLLSLSTAGIAGDTPKMTKAKFFYGFCIHYPLSRPQRLFQDQIQISECRRCGDWQSSDSERETECPRMSFPAPCPP